MAVVNVTPDSFHAGSRRLDAGEASDRALALVDEGADIIDIGGESTRPGALEVEVAEEARRVIPVLERLAATTAAILSVDTRKTEVARRALDAGADMVNDVSALDDEGMAELVAREKAGLAVMHMRGTPATMQHEPAYEDVVLEVRSHLSAAVRRAEQAGVDPGAILVDPGIGFGKTLEHNLALLAGLEAFEALGKPLLVGTSRKSFIGKLTGRTAEERLMGSVASAVAAALRGAHVLRVHDVAETREALLVADALKRAAAAAAAPSPAALQGAAR